MKTILPSLTCLLLVVVLAGTDILLRKNTTVTLPDAPTLALSADPVPRDGPPPIPATTADLVATAGRPLRVTADVPFGGDGQQLMQAAARRLYRHSSLAAKLRMEVDLFGQQLLGTGTYIQVGEGEDKLLRYEMTMQTDEHKISFLQVADGRFLWQRRDMPGGVDLGRVDLKRLRRELAGLRVAPASRDPSIWMTLGGLCQLLAGLDANFRFGPAQLTTAGETEMLSLEGTWNPRTRAPLPDGGQQTPTSGSAPDEAVSHGPHVPQRVHVLLGREDLIPYRIEYFRRDGATQQDAEHKADENAWRTLARIELYDVNLRAGIDPLRFVYKPDATQIQDRTQSMLEFLRPAAAQNP